MKKILSDDGILIGTFEDYEKMKNGNVVLSGYIANKTSPVVPPYVPVQQEERIVKAFKLDQRPIKQGLMCPNCHQSRYIEVIEAEKKNNKVIIQSINEGHYYTPNILIKDWRKIIKGKDLIEVLATDDLLSTDGIEFRTIRSLKELANLNTGLIGNNPNLACHNCDHISNAQTWVNEYKDPTAKHLLICNICGNEMLIQNEGDGSFNKESSKQKMKCTKCNFSTEINFSNI